MITSSGSEGITLKNVRYVHLIEPYWHPVRGEQVIGRARRIRSHDALPEEDRTVEVFQYLMTFSEEQLDPSNDVTQQIRLNDTSKIDKITPLTTDQSLHEISTIKKKFNTQLLMAIKESSIDCITHMSSKSKESIKCFQFTNPKSSAISYTGDYATQERDSATKMNKKIEKYTLKGVTLAGTKYAVDMKTKYAYDYDSYLQHRENRDIKPRVVGILKILNDKKTGKKTGYIEKIQ